MQTALLNAGPEFPSKTRAVTWKYETTLTLEQAREQAQSYAEEGINLLVSNGHRYLFPIENDPKALSDPFHFELWPTQESNAATSRVVQAMHERGIKVMHHTTAAYCPKLEMEKHPTWCQESIMDPGKPVHFGEYGGVYMYCMNNPEFRTAYYQLVLALQKQMNFDAWMIDEVEWLPDWYVCGCKYCREKFTKETGYVLPTDKTAGLWGDFEDPMWRAWLAARMRWSGDFFKDLRTYLTDHGIANDLPLTVCHAGLTDSWSSQYWGIDVIDLTRGTDWVFYEAYVNNGAPFYSWRRYLAEIQAYGALARVKTKYPGLILFYPWGDISEYSWCWAATFAMGQRLWRHKMPQPNFRWEQRHEYLTYPNGSEVVDVALLFSKPCRDFLRKDRALKLDASDPNNNRGYIDEWGAWAESLIENNIPHQVILQEDLTSTVLAKYKAVLLPSTECLSNAQADALLDYARQGGHLVISGCPGTRDENGAIRLDAGLTKKLVAAASKIVNAEKAESAHRGFTRVGKPAKVPQADIVDALSREMNTVVMADCLSWTVDAPKGVVVKVWENEQKSRIRIDALNCVGGDLKQGVVLDKGYEVPLPPVKVSVKLKGDIAGHPDMAVCYDPSTSTSRVIPVSYKGKDVFVEFEIQGALAIVELVKNPLPRNTEWLKKQNANWQVLGETLSPKQADEIARDMSGKGINSLLTDKHRYILYDADDYDQLTTGTFDNIWQGRPLRQSVEVTRNLSDACHKEGIRVIWHTTYCMVSRDLIERHPEWSQQDLRHPGKPAYFGFYGGNWNVCMNNPEVREAYFQRVAELTRETGVDGWMIDELEWLPDWYVCGCATCMDLFKRDTGFELPKEKNSPSLGNLEDPVWRAWISWRMKSNGQFFRDLRSYMEKEGLGGLAYTCCHAGSADTWSGQVWGIDQFELATGMNLCFYEAYIKNGAPYFSWKRHLLEMDLYGAIARNRTSGTPVLTLFYPRSHEESKFVSALTYWAGQRPWVTFSGTPTDFAPSTWAAGQKDVWDSGSQTVPARIGIYFSKATRDLIGGGERQENNRFYVNHYATWDLTLLENNVPRQVMIDDDILEGKMSQYKTIIIPSAICVSDQVIEKLSDWVQAGGQLVLAGKFAQRDETGAVRKSTATVDDLKDRAFRIYPEFSESPAHQSNYAVVGKIWHDARDPKEVTQICELLNSLKAEFPWKTNVSAKDVAVRVWKTPNGEIHIHLLNVAGTQLEEGTTVGESLQNGGVTWPESRPVEVELSKELTGGIAPNEISVRTIGMSGTPKAEIRKNKDGGLSVKIADLTDYAVVTVSSRKQLQSE